MIEFEVNGMTCGHCAARVTKSVQSVDAQAKVDIDLAGHRVKVETTGDANAIASAMTAAGYPAKLK